MRVCVRGESFALVLFLIFFYSFSFFLFFFLVFLICFIASGFLFFSLSSPLSRSFPLPVSDSHDKSRVSDLRFGVVVILKD